MNLWKTNLIGCDIESGDLVLFVTKTGQVLSGFIETHYSYPDDSFSGYFIRSEANYSTEDYEPDEIICWAYLADFIRTVPREILQSGLTSDTIQSDNSTLGHLVHYIRQGKEETRFFYTQAEALEFVKGIDICAEFGSGGLKRRTDADGNPDNEVIEVVYVDKCWN